MIRLAINGALGRMGQRIAALAAEDSRYQVVAQIDQHGAVRGGEALDSGGIDAVIDVSSDAGARQAAALAKRNHAALLVASTGLSPATRDEVLALRDSLPVMIAPNLSAGVAVMKRLAADAARLLGEGYDLSLIEYHHTAKKDAPSGTALSIAEAVRTGAGREISDAAIFSGRAGDIIGEHTLRLAGPGEYLEITHRATTRDLFARGALRACAWLIDQAPGAYTMEQMLSASKPAGSS